MSNNRLFVGNLSFSTTDDVLAGAFARFGGVTEAKVILDRMTGQSRGFGFVVMDSDAAAAKAIQELNGEMLDGRPLRVNEAERREGGGGGGGGGGRGGADRGGGRFRR